MPSIECWLRTVLAGIQVHGPALLTASVAAWARCSDREPEPPLRVLLADPYTLAQAGLKSVLSSDPRFTVIDEVNHGAVAAAQRLQPQFIVLDPIIAEQVDLELISDLRRTVPHRRLCLYTTAFEPRTYLTAMAIGVNAYLLKGRKDKDTLVDTLALVGRSGTVVTGCAVAERFRRRRLASRRSPAVNCRQGSSSSLNGNRRCWPW
jgi:DNA-binding NarL/FixJ family response regulator